MQETRKNCFGSKIRSTILRQTKTGKHECLLTWVLVLTCFRLTKGRAVYFPPETIVASFLHLMVLLPKVSFKHSCKRQLVVLHCQWWMWLSLFLLINVFWFRHLWFKRAFDVILPILKYDDEWHKFVLRRGHPFRLWETLDYIVKFIFLMCCVV